MRKALIKSVKAKQISMIRRFLRKNGTIDHIPVRDLMALVKEYLDTGFKCWYCGEKMYIGVYQQAGYKRFTVDHTTPLSGGGKNTIDNMVFCCSECNSIQNQRWQQKKEFESELALEEEGSREEIIDLPFSSLTDD